MKKCVCIKTCFFRNRVWTPGETLESSPEEVLPKWFTTADKAPAVEAKVLPPEPKTLSEAASLLPPTLGELLE